MPGCLREHQQRAAQPGPARLPGRHEARLIGRAMRAAPPQARQRAGALRSLSGPSDPRCGHRARASRLRRSIAISEISGRDSGSYGGSCSRSTNDSGNT